MCARGELVAVLPGIFTTPAGLGSWEVRLRAAALWAGPDAVLVRHAAARLTFWPELGDTEIAFAKPARRPRRRPDFPVLHYRVPAEMIWSRSGMSVSRPAYTAVDLAGGPDAGAAIDRALRARAATIQQMWAALAAMSNRRGNGIRRRLLIESRDSPWSELERRGHVLLRKARITGWRTNAWVRTLGGGFFVDVLLPGSKVIIEFDGWEFHGDRQAFEDDRQRRNELVLSGYVVLNFTWQQVADDPDWVIGCVRRAVKMQPSMR